MSIGTTVSIDVGAGTTNDYNTVGFNGDPDATAAARFTGMNILSGVHAASDEQINAVNDRFDIVEPFRTTYNAAKESS